MTFSTEEAPKYLSVSTLVEQIGPRSLRVLSPKNPPATPVTGTELVDASESLPEHAGTLLFVVSASALPSSVIQTIVEQAASHEYAAIAMKISDNRREELTTLADNAGVTLLEVAEHVSWRYLEATVDALLGEQNMSASATRHPSYEPLFSLANTIAERFGGSVVIEDLSRNVLAYSSVPGQLIDTLRTEGILTRQAPYSPFNDEQYRLVLRAFEPLQFPRAANEEARIALALRAGSVPLGTLWAIDGRPEPGAPLTADDLHLLSTTQELAASLMLDNLRIHEANQKPREAVLRRLLNATDVLGTELAELGLTADRGVTLTAFYNPRCRDSAIALAQVRNTVSKHHSSYRDETISVSLGGLIYTLIGTSDSTEVASVTERALPLIDRVVGEGSRAAIAAAVTHAGDISRSRQQLDSIMRCIEEVPEPRLLRREHVQPQLLINRVRDLITEEELVRNPLLDELSAQGNAASSELLRTLEAWCSNLGNVARTALDLGVHENTVRYRLNRLTETDRLSLEDPDVLLTTWLQLRTRAATESALPPVTQATHLSD